MKPARLGFRMPAEWEPQEAVWLSWPHRLRTWPGHFRLIPAKFAEIAAVISRFEEVRINIARPLQDRAWRLIEKTGAERTRIKFYDHATNDCWCRDHGPVFIRNDRTQEVALTDWIYNAWGGKYPPFDFDNRIPRRIGRALGLRRFAPGIVLEGGSIDTNGRGLLLTTESCLLNRNRNPDLSQREIERVLRDNLGVEAVVWLGRGIAGDDTDGHVDDLSRFFRVDGIVSAVERNPRDPNYRPLQENLERLASLRTPAGRRVAIIALPMPDPCFCAGQRLPASYANFLVVNGAVLMPAFRQPRRDAEAAAVLAGCFPGREIIPVDCRDLVLGLGTLHCISQQQPA
ncbi:MAG: agmatine deiminase family protein [Opitutaceae bacterium]